jgi:hypothetical protein
MLDIIEHVCVTSKEVVITYPTVEKAKAERLRFYGLRRALTVNRHSLSEKADRLEFVLHGLDRKHPNCLTVRFPTGAQEEFYAAVVKRLESDATGDI